MYNSRVKSTPHPSQDLSHISPGKGTDPGPPDKSYIEPIPCKNTEVYNALNSLICEYLEVNGLEQALQSFTRECRQKKLPCPNIALGDDREIKAAFTHYDGEQLLKSFDEGNLEDFLKLWKQFQTHIQVTSEDMKKLEVYLRVHFAIYPKAKNIPEPKQSQAMQTLKRFFEENSATLSSDATILPLFALPFVSDPRPHPIFKDLFHETWISKLRNQLETTVNKYFELLQENITIHCKLASVVVSNSGSSRNSSIANSGKFRVRKANSRSTGTVTSPSISASPSGKIDGSEGGGSAGDSVSSALDSMMKMSETAMLYHQERFFQLLAILRKTRRGLRGVRENYSKLMRVTSVLIGHLEKVYENTDGTELGSVLQECAVIYPELLSSNSKAPSTTSTVASSTAIPSNIKPDIEHFKKLAAAASATSIISESSDVSLLFAGIPDINMDNLNYEKIKESLASDMISSTGKLCLLQALRWLITKNSASIRRQVITHFVEKDIFGLDISDKFSYTLRNSLFSALLSNTPTYQKESISRLVNAFASTWAGRLYMSSTNYLIETLIQSLKTFKTQEESFICHMVIATLQKLSLRKNMRKIMIDHNVIPWVVKYIKSELERDIIRDELNQLIPTDEDTPSKPGDGNYGDTPFNNYLMEYAWALLMNLCLHPECIKSALTVEFEFLHCILIMLTSGRTSTDYTPYILSTLFSLLRSPELFKRAKDMSLDKELAPVIPLQPAEIQGHIKHLLSQLYEKENVDRLAASGETDYDDSDNPDPEDVEPELELQESWMNSLNETVTLVGDDLLIKEYLIPIEIPFITTKAPSPVDSGNAAIDQVEDKSDTNTATSTHPDPEPQHQDSANQQGSIGQGLFLRPTTPTHTKPTRTVPLTPGPNTKHILAQRRATTSTGYPTSSASNRREPTRTVNSVHVNRKNPLVHPSKVNSRNSLMNPVLMPLPLPVPVTAVVSNSNSTQKSPMDVLTMPPPPPPHQFIVGLPPPPIVGSRDAHPPPSAGRRESMPLPPTVSSREAPPPQTAGPRETSPRPTPMAISSNNSFRRIMNRCNQNSTSHHQQLLIDLKENNDLENRLRGESAPNTKISMDFSATTNQPSRNII